MDSKLCSILNNRNQILLKIITSISQEERWYSVKEISLELDLVERSTQRYINMVYDLIEEYTRLEGHYFILKVKKNKGMKLIIDQNANFSLLKNYICKNDENVQLLVALLFDKYTSVNDYTKKNDLGKNAVLSSLKKVEKFLAGFNLGISTRSFSVTGEEHQIRVVTYSVTWMLYSLDDNLNMLANMDEAKINSGIDLMAETLYLNLNTIERREIFFMLFIGIVRFRKKHEVVYKEEWDAYLPKEDNSQILSVLEKIYNNHQIFSVAEIRFLALSLTMRAYFYNQSSLRNYIIKTHRDNGSDIFATTGLFMEEFSKSISEIPKNKYESVFMHVFRSHLFAKMYKNVTFDYNSNYFYEYISEHFPNYIRKIQGFIDQLYIKSGNELFLEKIFLIQRYFMVLSAVKNSVVYEKYIKIYLRTSGPEILEDEIKNYISNYFSDQFNIEFVEMNYLQNPDLILTNIISKPNDEKTIVINYPLNKRDISSIRNYIERLL